MGNYGISINLQALHGACLRTLKGKEQPAPAAEVMGGSDDEDLPF